MSETATSEYEAVKAWWNSLTPVERLDATDAVGGGNALQAYRYHLLAASHAKLLELCKMWSEYFDKLERASEPGDPLCEARRVYHQKRLEITREAIAAAEALGESP